MRTLTLLYLGMAALATGACEGPSVRIASSNDAETGVLRAVDSLNCPETQGVLTRTATSADGLSCTYAGPRGSEVVLRLIRLSDDRTADQAVAALKAEVDAALPGAAERLGRGGEPSEPEVATAVTIDTTDGNPGAEDVVIRLPGVSIRASDGPEGGESADIAIGNGRERVNVNSEDGAVRVETAMRGADEGLRLSYILIDERAVENALRLAGFEARGPDGGPIVAAVVMSKDRRQDGVFDAAKDLVELNVGG